ncbi:hypothetical protein MY10362_003312 [Beauveria mimosiformis]
MKSTFALIGAYAALASAFTPGRHLHFPRGNGTTTAAPSPQGPLTTLTVKETRTSTITSCSSTVTNCPAGPGITAIPETDREIKTVTQTVDLTTIVCPVSEASTISDKIISQHKSGSSILPSQTAPIADVTATGSPTPIGPLTTLTVKETLTSTITSCASTVTNCPAGKPEMTAIPETDREIKTVTQTVDLTTIVCPVSEASTISDKIISQHKSGSSVLPSQTQVPVQTTDIVITKTITLTKGSGNDKTLVPSVITTTIKSTITPTASGPKPGDATITTTATSTSTKTVTITRAKATPTGPANGGGDGNEKCVSGAAPATVTVTVAQTTVTASAATVTVTAPCEASAAPGGSKKVDNKPVDNKPVDNGSKPTDADATPCETDGTTTVEATVTVVPYPANNSTTVTATGAPVPSGFARLRR